jgi:hypothetical protein
MTFLGLVYLLWHRFQIQQFDLVRKAPHIGVEQRYIHFLVCVHWGAGPKIVDFICLQYLTL